MSGPEFSPRTRRMVGVSCPGGAAPQYRVQYKCRDSAQWRLYAVCSHSGQADAVLEMLTSRGHEARVIRYAILPAA